MTDGQLHSLVRYATNTPQFRIILTHSENLAFRPKSGFKNKCRARARFGLQKGPFRALRFSSKTSRYVVELNHLVWKVRLILAAASSKQSPNY